MSGRALTLAALALALSGCLVGPDYRRPDYPVPATFRGGPPEGPADARSFGDLEWWAIFEDPELISLIRTALAENYDVRVAASRILDARAQVVVGIFGIAPSISLPLFNAGRLQAGVDSAASRTQEAILRYQQTIQQAFREVDDALVAYAKNREFRVEKQELVATLLLAVDLADIRYQGGVTSYLEVLDLETRLFTAELDLVVASLSERTAVVQLYRALGGGWKQQAPQAGPPTTPAADEMRTAEDLAGRLPTKRDSRVGSSGAGSPATGARPAPGPQALQPVKR
jgi:outer membrane protein TolC